MILTSRIDPWELQYIKHYPGTDRSDLVWDDVTAYEKFPEARWVYDKKYIDAKYNSYKGNGIDTPHITKPRINLEGLSRGFSSSPEKIEILGNFYQERAVGRYLSCDYLRVKGKPHYHCMSARPSPPDGKFWLFHSVMPKENDQAHISNVKQLIWDIWKTVRSNNYVINIETIGDTILEAHLRPSLQFFDISNGLLQKYIDNDFTHSEHKKTYSVQFFSDEDRLFQEFDEQELPKVETVSSIQYCWYPGAHLSYDSRRCPYKTLVVNGTNFKDCYRYGQIILSKLEG